MWLPWLTDGTVVGLPEMTYSTGLVTGKYDPLTRRQTVGPRTVRRPDPRGRSVSVQRRVTDAHLFAPERATGGSGQTWQAGRHATSRGGAGSSSEKPRARAHGSWSFVWIGSARSWPGKKKATDDRCTNSGKIGTRSRKCRPRRRSCEAKSLRRKRSAKPSGHAAGVPWKTARKRQRGCEPRVSGVVVSVGDVGVSRCWGRMFPV